MRKKTADWLERISFSCMAIMAAYLGTSDWIGGIEWRIAFLSMVVLCVSLAFGWDKIASLFACLFKTIYLNIARLYYRLKVYKAAKRSVPEEKEIKQKEKVEPVCTAQLWKVSAADKLFEIAGTCYRFEEERVQLCTLPSPLPVLEQEEVISEYDWYRLENGVYIIHRASRYPCFDSYDRMYDHRHYRAFVFCFSAAEVKAKSEYMKANDMDVGNIQGKNNVPLLPFVYVDDDNGRPITYKL